MTTIFLCFILLFVLFLLGSIRSKGIVRLVCIFLVSSMLLFPLGFILLKSPLQQGKFLPQIGKLSIILIPPQDLWEYRARTALHGDKTSYELECFHKYVGNYQVDLILGNRAIDPFAAVNNSLKMEVLFKTEDGEVVFQAQSGQCHGYKGTRDDGVMYVRYEVPDDAPVGKNLWVEVRVDGDIRAFKQQYGPADIVIRKTGDL